MRRESYSNRFATALEGVDLDNPGTALDRTGHPNPVPRVVGPIRRTRPVQVRDDGLPASRTPTRAIKMTRAGAVHDEPAGAERPLPGPRARSRSRTRKRSTTSCAISPTPGRTSCRSTSRTCRRGPTTAREYALEAIERALDGVDGTTALHTCFGYAAIVHDKPNGYPFLAELDSMPGRPDLDRGRPAALDPAVLEQLPSKRVILGVLDLGDMNVESGEVVAGADPGRAPPHRSRTPARGTRLRA